MTDIGKQKFVCLDCETTGLDPASDRIIEVAAICFDSSNAYSSFESLVNPERSIPEESIVIHHITSKMVSGKPTIKEVLPEFLKFVGNNIIMGHGIGFDIEVIAKSAEREGIPTTIRENRFVDTLRMARIYGESPSNSLEQLRKHFQIEAEVAHRAMSDVTVNIEVFKRFMKLYHTVERLFDVLSRPILLKDMPLGKHKGRSFKEVPIQYLQWAVNKDFDQDLLYSIKTELKKRKKGNLFYQEGNPFKDL
ncbi:MAG: DNA polymerase III PolC-type [Chlamydiae bacterium]|nr:DNA polymerase III PolC-type [Chlamydiota bacterium]